MTDDIAKRLEKAEALAEMAEYYRQERDYAWERLERYREISRESDAVLLGKIDKLTAERDELRTRAASYENQMEFYRTAATLRFMTLETPKEIMEAVVQDLTSERNEARLQLELLKKSFTAFRKNMWPEGEKMLEEMRAKVDQVEAELLQYRSLAKPWEGKTSCERDALRAEVDVLRGVGCCAGGDGPCGVCLKCAYRHGAEAMREAAAQAVSPDPKWTQPLYDSVLLRRAGVIRALPIPEEP